MLRRTSTLLVLLGLLSLLPAAVSAQGGGNRAALVVRAGDGSVQTKCVSFSESQISGEELLTRSGMTVVLNPNFGSGGAVCSINGYGCAFPSQDCFCKCQGVKCEYWAYYHWIGGAWKYSDVGATGFQVKNGALEGWSWGQGNFTSGTIPPTVKFEDICTTPTATPTATATPTRTPSPTPTTVVASPGQTATAVSAWSNPPEAQFEVAASTVHVGACTVLQWVTWDAQQISLDGAAVTGQDRREVCPQTTQRYVLTASNPAGQTRRELTISVVGAAAQPTQSAPPTAPPAIAVGSNSQTSPLPTPATTRPAEGTARPTPTPPPQPTAFSAAAALGAVAHAQSAPTEMPTRPPATTSVAVAVPALDLSSLLTPTATQAAVRRQIAEGQPTPTPILMARVGSGDDPARPGPNISPASTQRPATPERDFRMSLLPGYGAYVLMAAMLVGAGAVVTRRKRVT